MVVYWIAAYIIGNFLTAWWIGKWKGIDLRQQRSGNLGARNAGAVIGKTAFWLTFIGDALKAVFVIWLGQYLDFADSVIALGGLAVICGHLFPIWLKGKGGKGIATFIGVSLYFTPELFAVMFIVFAVFFPFVKSATLTMLFSLAAYIIAIFAFQEFENYWPLVTAIIFILAKHRFDISESFNQRFSTH